MFRYGCLVDKALGWAAVVGGAASKNATGQGIGSIMSSLVSLLCPAQRFLRGALRRSLARPLPISGQMGNDAEQSLDHHQLSAVIHFVLFGPHEHFKQALRATAGHAHLF